MSASETRGASASTTTTTETGLGLLDQVIGATKQTERDRAEELIRALTEEALKGTVTFNRNLVVTFDRAIAEIDRKVSEQLNQILHDERFLKLEGSWRGLNYLVMNSETGTSLKIRMLQLSKRELGRDLQRAVEFDQSQLFKKVYENEFGSPGGEPYGALVGDYEWTAHSEDVETLRLVSNVAAGAFAPFISGVGAGMFGFQDWSELSKPRDLAKIFETTEYIKWRGFRETEDARFVSLVMPRVIARVPYGAATKPIDEFAYEEAPKNADGTRTADGAQPLLLDERGLCDGRAPHRCIRPIQVLHRDPRRGRRRQGSNLPTHTFISDDGDGDAKCPTEIGITDRREAELSNLGFLPLCHYATRTTPCSSAPSPRRSRRSTIGPRQRPTPRFRRACPTHGDAAGSPTS